MRSRERTRARAREGEREGRKEGGRQAHTRANTRTREHARTGAYRHSARASSQRTEHKKGTDMNGQVCAMAHCARGAKQPQTQVCDQTSHHFVNETNRRSILPMQQSETGSKEAQRPPYLWVVLAKSGDCPNILRCRTVNCNSQAVARRSIRTFRARLQLVPCQPARACVCWRVSAFMQCVCCVCARALVGKPEGTAR